MKTSIATRFKIVGTEVVGLGAFLLVILGLNARQTSFNGLNFGWDYALIGAVLIAVGLEMLSLIKYLPKKTNLNQVPS